MDPNALNGSCVSINFHWSITEGLDSNSHLAALLAGFMLTALIFLLARETTRGKDVPAHTIALFAVGILILGVDSYLYALGSGQRPPSMGDGIKPGGEYVCAVAWTQSQAPNGMLAVGATLMVAGLGWMLTRHAKTADVHSRLFGALGNVITLIIIATTMLLLVFANLVYLYFMETSFRVSLGGFASAVVVGVGVLAGVVSCGMIVLRTIGIVRRLKVNAAWADELEPRFKTLAAAALLTAAFTFFGTAFAFFVTAPHLPSKATMWISIALGLFVPCLIDLAIGYSVPGPSSWWEAHPEHAGSHRVRETAEPGGD